MLITLIKLSLLKFNIKFFYKNQKKTVMANLILNHFHNPFILYKKNLKEGKPAYIYASNKKSCLQISSVKKDSLCEVFQKAQAFLKKDIEAAETPSEIQKQ